MSDLAGARAKVRRAEKHLRELDEYGQRWAETVGYELRLELDGPTTLVARMFHPTNTSPPISIALAAGDAIHNLRSALDHVVYQLAVDGGRGGERSEYPIFESRDSYRANVARFLDGVDAKDRERIEATQPYHLREGDAWIRPTGPEDPLVINAVLRLLRRLDNQDKHRLILEGTAEAALRQPKFRGVLAAEGTFPSRSIPLEDGSELFRIKTLKPINDLSVVEVGYRPAFSVLVTERSASDGDRVKASIGTLHTAARAVQSLIGLFQADMESEPATDELSPAPMIIEWPASSSSGRVGVFVDLGMRRRSLIDFWPEVITAIEKSATVGGMWSELEAVGRKASFVVRAIGREAGLAGYDIAVRLTSSDDDLDVWFGTLLPAGETPS